VTGLAALPAAPRRGRRDRGAVIMLTAIALPLLLLMTSFAIDLGRQRALRRTMQAKADVIALDLARLIDGGTVANSIIYQPSLAASAARNDIPVSKVTSVEWGTLDSTTKEFVACTLCIPTAVKVTTHDSASRLFGAGSGAATRSAVGLQDAIAGFSIGSFAAAVNPLDPNYSSGSIPLLNRMLGDALEAGVLSYNGLATTSLTYLQIANQLGFATPTELFASDTSAFEVIEASSAILQQGNQNAAQVAVLNGVINVSDSPLKDVTIGEVAGVNAGAENSALESNVNLLDFLSTAAFIANGSAIDVPATAINFPGITSGDVSLSLIQGPQTAFGGIGTQASTSQLHVSIPAITVGGGNACATAASLLSSLSQLISGLTSLLGLTDGLCSLTTLRLPLTIRGTLTLDFAQATGTIDRIACPGAKQLGVGVASGLVTSTLGLTVQVGNGAPTASNTFPLTLRTEGLPTTGRADFEIPDDVFDEFRATNPGSGSLGLNSTSISSNAALTPLLTGLTGILNPFLTNLNDNFIIPVANLLGVRVAGSDVAARAVNCTAVKLAG
jgi:uncharacterized membrane protein